MTLSILAVVFLLFLIAIIFYGYGFIMRAAKPLGSENREVCTLCKGSFDKKQLVERQIGDSKLLYFCKKCIGSLADDGANI